MDFSGRGGGAGGEKVDEHRVMQEVESTLRMQFLQEFYQTVRDKCFKYCISSPSTSLSGSDQKCLSRCMDRYQDATNIVSKAVLSLQGLEQ